MCISHFMLYSIPVLIKQCVDSMPRNKIQFQKGLSEVAFHERYGSEVQCVSALEAMRWPDGFVCPVCHSTKSHRLDRRALHQSP